MVYATRKITQAHTQGTWTVDWKGEVIYTGGMDGLIKTWNGPEAEVGKELNAHDLAVISLKVHSSGFFGVSSGMDGKLMFHDFDGNGKVEKKVNGQPWQVAVSNGDLYGCISLDNSVGLFNAANTESSLLKADGITGTGMACVFSPSGHQLATSSTSGQISIWDITTSKMVNSIQVGCPVRNLSWTHSLLFSAQDDGRANVWDVTRQPDQVASLSHTKSNIIPWVTDVKASPSTSHVSGLSLATCSSDGKVRTWDLNTRQIIATFGGSEMMKPDTLDAENLVKSSGGHVGTVWSLSYSPSGKQLASVGEDGMLIVYETS